LRRERERGEWVMANDKWLVSNWCH
jgi:hypothetical protein